MTWVGVTGSWRKSSPDIKRDIKREVFKILKTGRGIVTGGALGVDYMATKISLNFEPNGTRTKVIIPTTLEIYAEHYRKRATEGVIASQQAEQLIQQLRMVRALGSLEEGLEETEVNERTYYLRNTKVVEASDEMLAFQINQSAGTQDTIEKARAKGIKIKVFSYVLQ